MITRDITVRKPEDGDCRRTFLDGSLWNSARLPSLSIGRGIYKPGWRWSEHAGKQTGKESTQHIGYIVSGRMIIKDAAGRETAVEPGEAFEVGPNHDAWVDGNEPCVALDFEIK